MCGIACLIGGKDSPIKCYQALEKLEYRGYDSAGMAGLTKQGIVICKREGRVNNILSFTKEFSSNMVISHTRWATHGKPCEENAHPHLSCDQNFALVHNGIIENYQQIKTTLEEKGVLFKSETDSECVVQLLSSMDGKNIEKLSQTLKHLEGSYALAIIDKKEKCILATRKKSPLYVAQTTQGIMFASDLICFNGIAKNYYAIKEGEIVLATKRRIKVYNKELLAFKPEFVPLNNEAEEISKGEYKYFMEKEINEIPAVIKRIYAEYKDSVWIKDVKHIFENVDKIKLVGCGTAYHAGMYGARVLEKALKIPCEAVIASEYKYSNPLVDGKTLGIFVSQSGETADTIGCAELLKQRGAKTLAITNVNHSALAGLCDKYLPVCAGAEIAVASTKAYVAQILVLYILSKVLTDQSYDLGDIEGFADKAKEMLSISDEIVEVIERAPRVFFIGRQLDSVTALEGALKLKEISYKSAEGYPAGELKHGSIALIEQGTPVVAFATDKSLLEKTMSACNEVKSRGATVILVAKEDVDIAGNDYKINLPVEFESELLSMLSIIPFQLLAFKVSERLGNNPDKPRNLAKSVTVE